MLVEPNCSKIGCPHYQGISQPDGTEKSERVVCTLYPEGIPAQIAYTNSKEGCGVLANYNSNQPRDERGRFAGYVSTETMLTSMKYVDRLPFDRKKIAKIDLSDFPEEWVDTRSLIATQADVEFPQVRKYQKELRSKRDLDSIDVVEYKGTKYVMDGTHRTVASLLERKSQIKARILRLDDEGNPIEGIIGNSQESKMNEQDKVNLLKRFARFLGVNNLQTQTCDGSQPKKRKKGKLPEQTTNHATQGDVSMALSQKQREQIVDELIANSEYWAEEDRGMLASMSDRKLQALKEKLEKELNAEAVANAARQGASELTDNAAIPPQLEKKGKGKAKPEDEEEDMEEGEKKKLTTNAQPLTADEWKKQAPPEIQAVFNHAEAIMAREKAALVAKLTANASDEQKNAIEPIYNAMDFEKLQVLAAAIPEKKEEQTVSYFGAATPIGNMAMDDKARKDILPLPTIDWAKEAKATK